MSSSAPPSAPRRVLVVDDEPDLVEVVCGALHLEGWTAMGVLTGKDAVRAATAQEFDAVVLDMMLPDLDGLEVMRRVHAARPETRVLFLTARDAVEDRIEGITAGGDDYVTKPFSLDEVIARLRGLMRRAKPADETTKDGAAAAAPAPLVIGPDALVVGDLVMDEAAREVSRGGVPVDLSPTEFALLRYLMRHPRQVLSKPQILDKVWSYDFGGQAHVVELYISYLRKKVDAGRPPMIHTVRGAGYVLRPATP
jgi:two-component system OmpR family response regulator